MKKNIPYFTTPELKAKYRPDFSNLPTPEKHPKELRKLIYEFLFKDLHRNLRNKTNPALTFKAFFILQAPRSKAELRMQDEFDLVTRNYLKIEADDYLNKLMSPKGFLAIYNFKYPTRNKLYPKRYITTDDKEEPFLDYGGIDKTESVDKKIDAKRFIDIFKKHGVTPKTRIPVYYLALVAFYEGVISYQDLNEYFNPEELTFWESIFVAYYSAGLIKAWPPFFILKPPKENAKIRILEDFLRINRQCILKKRSWKYGVAQSKQLNRPYSVDGKNYGNLLEDLLDYPGIYKENRLSWSLYERIMGDQGPLDKVGRPGFVHLLVDILAKLNDRKKYDLAALFLRGYLGLRNITALSIKAHLKPRKKSHK